MRISDARYSRDRLRYDLALRFIQHEARTSTIRLWTGLTDDRIRKLYHTYVEHQGSTRVTRHRGRSPKQAAFFTRTPRMRHETAVLASVCYLLGVLPTMRQADAPKTMPGVQRGEALCEAFESYRRLMDTAHISFEHAVFLVVALARGEELSAALCSECNSLIVIDRCVMPVRRCFSCEETLRGRLL